MTPKTSPPDPERYPASRDAKLVVLHWDELTGGISTGSLHSWEQDATALKGTMGLYPIGPKVFTDPQVPDSLVGSHTPPSPVSLIVASCILPVPLLPKFLPATAGWIGQCLMRNLHSPMQKACHKGTNLALG